MGRWKRRESRRKYMTEMMRMETRGQGMRVEDLFWTYLYWT